MTCYYMVSFRQKPEKPRICFRVFDLLFIQLKPYENEFSTALSECKAVARCATRKTDTAINRIKTVGALLDGEHHSENSNGGKQK